MPTFLGKEINTSDLETEIERYDDEEGLYSVELLISFLIKTGEELYTYPDTLSENIELNEAINFVLAARDKAEKENE